MNLNHKINCRQSEKFEASEKSFWLINWILSSHFRGSVLVQACAIIYATTASSSARGAQVLRAVLTIKLTRFRQNAATQATSRVY